MSTIVMRSAYKLGGLFYRPGRDLGDLHHVESDYRGRRIVTRTEVNVAKLKRHEGNLASIERAAQPRAYKLWTAYYDMDIFGGWQAFVENRDDLTWIDRDNKPSKPRWMKLFPLLLDQTDWEGWKIECARQYKRATHHGKPRGVVYLMSIPGERGYRICDPRING